MAEIKTRERFPTISQIEDLLKLPENIAIDAAITFGHQLNLQAKELNEKFKLLKEVSKKIDKNFPKIC
jgi:hypothetical protein